LISSVVSVVLPTPEGPIRNVVFIGLFELTVCLNPRRPVRYPVLPARKLSGVGLKALLPDQAAFFKVVVASIVFIMLPFGIPFLFALD
jgi:hypothetical protein